MSIVNLGEPLAPSKGGLHWYCGDGIAAGMSTVLIGMVKQCLTTIGGEQCSDIAVSDIRINAWKAAAVFFIMG